MRRAVHFGPDPASTTTVPKSTEKLDLATRAAWLYYVAGNTQNEIAEKLQVSRPVAQRLVAFAVEKNLIRVRVDHRGVDNRPSSELPAPVWGGLRP